MGGGAGGGRGCYLNISVYNNTNWVKISVESGCVF